MGRQEQSAGDSSQQLQAGRDIYVQGVSAADVVEITQLEVRRVLDDLSLTAETLATQRLERFEERVRAQFAENSDLRGAFADPDFQFSLRDAGRAAASNDDPHTEDLLVDLLTNRAEQANGSRVRLATSHAIRAADKLGLEALNGLTALWVLQRLVPSVEDDLDLRLQGFEDIDAVLCAMGLPDGDVWLEDADALSLVRLDPANVSQRKPFADYLARQFEPFLRPGLDANDNMPQLKTAHEACPELASLWRPHPLKPGFQILQDPTREALLERLPEVARAAPVVLQVVDPVGFGVRDPLAFSAFEERLQGLPGLRAVAEWWNAVPPLRLTLVGTVIGFVNARRYIRWQGISSVAQLLGDKEA